MNPTPNTATQRMTPNGGTLGRTFVVNGRSYSSVGGVFIDAPPQDASELEANGWVRAGGRDCVGVGTTTARPVTGLYNGASYIDTTLGYVVIHDGASWRNPVTGAAV